MTDHDPDWQCCQETIRKLLLTMAKEDLIHSQAALERESSEPEKLEGFWKYARKLFDEQEAAS
jgi:hypothetical protein